MNVGVELWVSEALAGMIEAPKLPSRTLTLEAMVVVEARTPVSVVLCRPAAEAEEASKPVSTAVKLFPTGVMDDCDS